MKDNAVFRSIPIFLTRLRNWPANTVWKLVMRRRLSPEEYVDRTFERAMGKIRQGIAGKLRHVPAGSSSCTYLEKLQTLRDEVLMIEMASRAYPNSERNGCPPYRALFELVSSGPSHDPVWKHIERCSPCTMEIRTIKIAQEPRPS